MSALSTTPPTSSPTSRAATTTRWGRWSTLGAGHRYGLLTITGKFR
jgi:hypothetical protein